MSAISQPRIQTFVAAAAMTKGQAVKFGADEKHVALASASTDAVIGTVYSDSVISGDPVEVAIPGGGGKGLCHGTIAAGKFVCAYTDGSLQQVTASGDRHCGIAMAAGVAGDIIPLEIVVGVATAANQ